MNTTLIFCQIFAVCIVVSGAPSTVERNSSEQPKNSTIPVLRPNSRSNERIVIISVGVLGLGCMLLILAMVIRSKKRAVDMKNDLLLNGLVQHDKDKSIFIQKEEDLLSRIANLEEDISNKNCQLEDLAKTKEEQSKKLLTLEQTIKGLTKQKDENKSTVLDTNKELKKVQSELEISMLQIEKLITEKEEGDALREHIASELAQKNQDILDLDQTIKLLKFSASNNASQVQEISTKLHRANQNITKLERYSQEQQREAKAQTLDFQKQLLQKDDLILEMTNTMKSMQTNLETLTSELNHSRQRVDNLLNENARLKDDCIIRAKMTDELWKKNQKIEDLNQTVQHLKSTVGGQASLNKELKVKLQQTEQELVSAEQNFVKQLKEKETILLEVKNASSSLQKQFAALNSDLDYSRKQMEDLKAVNTTLSKEIATLNNCSEGQKELEITIQSLGLEKATLKKEKEALEQKCKSIADKYAELIGHNNHNQKIHHMEALKQENLSLTKEVEKLRRTLATLKAEGINSKDVKKFDRSQAFKHPQKE